MEEVISTCEPLVALIVGVTGMTGVSLAETLKSPQAPGGPWKVYGSALRPKPTWFSSSLLDAYIAFDATSNEDTAAKLGPISAEVTHVFWVAIQVRENEEANVLANATMLANVLTVLQSNPLSRLSHITLQTGTQHYMGPVHDPTHSAFLLPHEPPFVEDSPRLPYPNFYYALEDIVASFVPKLTYSVHRASLVLGASSRSAYNALLTLSTYAVICRYQGLPFRFPGTRYTWEHFCDMSDARVLAEQHVWAAVTPQAKNQAFNCANGDVFTWKSVWKVLCDLFDVEFVPFEEQHERFDFVGTMAKKGKVWEEIVETHGLHETKLKEITCAAGMYNILHFEFQHVCSMNKSREFGFFGYANTLKNIRVWVERLRKMKILP
ncbi:unnamed protein product [Bemisia tabaci]|uniref:PRISE-like Rossmann-fold domain-containing protein n=1 Tax=Bemisia tabaci TaxID=7038 RepID=A0A9P0G5B3_BEMTA|nr:unnamed protein product [Bemisia tabaci]